MHNVALALVERRRVKEKQRVAGRTVESCRQRRNKLRYIVFESVDLQKLTFKKSLEEFSFYLCCTVKCSQTTFFPKDEWDWINEKKKLGSVLVRQQER